MAKRHKRSRAKRQRLRWLRINGELDLSNLGPDALVGALLGTTVTERTYFNRIGCTYALHGLTAGEGPVIIGWAHGDYTDAEVEAWVENTTAWDEGDLVSQEVRKRKIRQVGTFGDGTVAQELNDGKKLWITAGWIQDAGSTLRLWCYNDGAILTTGAQVVASGHVTARPA